MSAPRSTEYDRIIGPAHYDDLQEMLGIDMRDGHAFRAHYEERKNVCEVFGVPISSRCVVDDEGHTHVFPPAEETR